LPDCGRSNNPRTTSRTHARIGHQNSTMSFTINIVLLVYAPWGDTNCFTIAGYTFLKLHCMQAQGAGSGGLDSEVVLQRLMGCVAVIVRYWEHRWRWVHHMLPEMCVHPQFAKLSPPPPMRRRSIIPMSTCSHEGRVTSKH
jgi:hypothetical protein